MNSEHFSRPGYDIALRPLRMSDLDSIMLWINDPVVTRNFAGMSQTITREEEEEFLRRAFASSTDRLFAIVSQDGDYLGNAGLHKIYWPARNARLGIVLGAANSRGRGLGQQTLKLLIAHAFQREKLHKVWMVHYESNAVMAHIAQKTHFQKEGVMRDEYFHNGAFHNMVRWSLLQTDPYA